jgi:nucleotide-binding universal stress UspA family protein
MNTNLLTNLPALKSFAPLRAASPLRVFNAGTAVQRPARADNLRTTDKRVRSILVPLNGSAFAEHAIPLALGIAEQRDAVVPLAHVVAAAEVLDPYDALHFADSSLTAIKGEKQKYLADVIERVSAKSSALVASRVIDGRTVSLSLNELPGLDADLIVMATHGRGLIGRFWHGSVAHSLLQRVSAPLIFVRGSDSPVNLEAQTINHVLLSLDGANDSEKALDPLLSLGLFPDARHTLMHVVPLEPKYVVQDYALRTEWVPSRHRWISGTEYLHPFARRLQENGRRVHAKVVNSDEPAGQVVLRAADQVEAGLIAVTYRRQWPITRLLWPSCAEYLFQNCGRPLMFVPETPSS